MNLDRDVVVVAVVVAVAVDSWMAGLELHMHCKSWRACMAWIAWVAVEAEEKEPSV